MNARHAPTRWLSFFGTPSLIDGGSRTPIVLKYRNGGMLLGFLAAHPGRIFRRETLADMFWPELDSTAGRRNLRVVLSDLSAALKALGLAEALAAPRDWLCFRPPGSLWTDESLLLAIKADNSEARHWLPTVAGQIAQNPAWLDLGDAKAAEDFQEWLGIQRTHLENLFQALPSPGRVSPPALPDDQEVPVELETLALLHIEIEARQPCVDERDAWRDLQRQQEIILKEIRLLGGEPISSSLDGFTFAFGHGSIHSGYRWLALRAAANLHALLSEQYRVRAAALSGRLLVEQQDGLRASGQRLGLLKILCAAADEDEILVDDSYRDLANAFGATPRERLHWRGAGQSVQTFGQALGQLSTFLLLPTYDASTEFFGREDILEDLEHAWRATSAGRTQHHCLQGPPGIGKTRSAHEFASRLQALGAPVFWLGARSETATQPWSALHELLSRIVSTCTGDTWPVRIDSFTQRFQRTLPREQRDLLASFLETRGLAYNQRSAFADLLHAILCPSGTPSLIVIDDAQWIDPASANVLRAIAGKPSSSLFLATQRDHPQPAFFEGCQVHELPPLPDQAAHAILKALPDGDLLDHKSCHRIVSAAQGRPIYLLAGENRQGSSFAEHLQALVNSLGPAASTMKRAALFGIQFRQDDLGSLVGTDIANTAIEQAIASHLLVSRGPRTWAFFHPLLQAHLYQLMERRERLALAPRAAAILASRGELARAASLYEEGGQIDAALEHFTRAANLALDQEDILAASQLFDQVARLGYGNDERGQWARMRHARALIIRDGYGSASVQEICQQVRASIPEQRPGEELSFIAIAYAYLGSGSDHAEAGLELAAEMAPLAQTPIQQQTAIWAKANSLFWLGRFREALPLLAQALDMAKDLPFEERIRYFPSDPLVLGNAQYAWVRWFMGDPAGAEVHIRRAHFHAQRSRLRQDTAIVYCFQAALCWFADDLAGLTMNANEAWLVADSEEFTLWKTVATLLQTLARAYGGESPRLLELLAAEQSMRASYPGGLNTGRWLAAAALLASGHHFIALSVINRAIRESDRQEHQYCLMELWRLRAAAMELLPMRRRSAITQSHLNAVTLAQKAGAQGWIDRWYPETLPGIDTARLRNGDPLPALA